MGWWLTVAVVCVGLLALTVIALALRPYRASRRGGMLDLTGAQPRGELDLDWSDPRRLDDEGVVSIGTERTSAG